ncbi:37S ribosomal protein S9 [Nemania sp. NC0429]|nr:37S ribosomal protein S9 [Nemania sp. NC0429]
MIAAMSSLHYGIRCLRAFPASTITKRLPLAGSTHFKCSASKRAFVTTTPRRQADSDLTNSLEAAGFGDEDVIAAYARPMPVSPSYFSRHPQFNDSFVRLQELARKYARLPVIPQSQVERVAWKTKEQFRQSVGEHVKGRDYATCIGLVKRLHQIHPDLMPEEVQEGLQPFKRYIDVFLNRPTQMPIDKFGRSHGVGKRKSSIARAWLVEGTGEVLINGKPMNEAFGRIHDRESALWGLKSTERLDKYNVWALVGGGGTTGQAEALAMAIAKALVVHEPPLKTPLRRAGCITRDPRTVERKKAGHLKARKRPAWVKR